MEPEIRVDRIGVEPAVPSAITIRTAGWVVALQVLAPCLLITSNLLNDDPSTLRWLVAGLVVAVLLLYLPVSTTSLVRIDDVGVTRRSWLGTRDVAWSDVRKLVMPDGGWFPNPRVRWGWGRAIKLPAMTAGRWAKGLSVNPPGNPIAVAQRLAQEHRVPIRGSNPVFPYGRFMLIVWSAVAVSWVVLVTLLVAVR